MTTNKYDFTEKLFHKNEVKHNKFSSIAVLVLGIVYLAMSVLYKFGLYDLVYATIAVILHLIGWLDVFVYLICRYLKYDSKNLRVLIIVAIILTSGTGFFFYPMTSTFILYGPVVISALYYDKKLVHRIAAINWLTYSVLLWLNVVVEKVSPVMQNYHAIQGVEIWKLPKEVLLYRFIPFTILFMVTSHICSEIAKGGRKLIIENAQESLRNAKIDYELKTAADIQNSSMPNRNFTGIDGRLRINAVMRPAKIVGGDFYDYFNLNSDIVVLIADVSDKGFSAAMFMMKAKNAIRSEVESGKSLEEAVSSVNNILNFENREDMFVTLWIASINVNTGIGKFVNCGHSSPIILHEDKSISKIENEPDSVLGVFENIEYSAHTIELSEGDVLLMYTDGMTDAVNSDDEFFGEQRLVNAFINSSENDDLCLSIVDEIDEFSIGSEQFDDMTALALSVVPNYSTSFKKITKKATYEAVESTIDTVNSLLAEYNCPEDIRRNIDVVVDEICGNITDYAYPEQDGDFIVEIMAGENYAVLTFIDAGLPFDPTNKEDEEKTDELSVGGVGIDIVKKLVDKWSYARMNDRNILRIVKVWK